MANEYLVYQGFNTQKSILLKNKLIVVCYFFSHRFSVSASMEEISKIQEAKNKDLGSQASALNKNCFDSNSLKLLLK